VAKFPLFALLPTAPLFNVHQHIAYGGTLGQYHLLGGRAFAADLALHWATVSICLVLWASVWRGLAEAAALAAAHVAPARAARVRRAVESACWWLYYAGVPLLLLLRFAPW
jgi:apolipoprotein N-acyltransferase